MTNTFVLDEILSCQSLPSLPAVAVRVIELTGDRDCSMDELAGVIEADQALAAKVLRTVNSSFYGLREPCATIKRAIVMLGLSPVKTLTLGFSLVSAIDMRDPDAFPWRDYWRRGLFAAVGAKAVCDAAKLPCGDEAFLAGLLHDVGMVAMHEALREHYAAVIERAGGDHARLVRHEIAAFELQHPEIGAMLAERWRLPSQLILPIRYHERPTAAPSQHVELVQAVAVANTAHDVLTRDDPREATGRFYAAALRWFRLAPAEADEVLRRINRGADELSGLFSLDTGDFGDTDELVTRASERLVEISRREPRESYAAQKLEELVIGSAETDPLTGIPTRAGFEAAFAATFAEARGRGEPLTLAQIAIDGLGQLNLAAGQLAVDEVVLGAVAIMHKHFEPMGGVVCRLGSSVFTVMLPGAGQADAAIVAEHFRTDVGRFAPDWVARASAAASPPTITVSVGLSAADDTTRDVLTSPQRLLLAGAQAIKAARAAGGNCVRAFVPQRDAA